MPMPAMADSRCSTVEILTPSLISVVDSVVSPTFSALAGIHLAFQIDAAEHDTCVDWSGPQGQVDLLTRVQTDTGRPDDVLQCALADHGSACKPLIYIDVAEIVRNGNTGPYPCLVNQFTRFLCLLFVSTVPPPA